MSRTDLVLESRDGPMKASFTPLSSWSHHLEIGLTVPPKSNNGGPSPLPGEFHCDWITTSIAAERHRGELYQDAKPVVPWRFTMWQFHHVVVSIDGGIPIAGWFMMQNP